MAANRKYAPGSAGVDALVAALDHPLKAVIEETRVAIIGSDPLVTEQVKWNAPSFCHRGEDRVTFNIRPNGTLLFVFHRGAKAKDGDAAGFAFDDLDGLMSWPAADRGLVTVGDLAQWNDRREAILALIPRWMAAADAGARQGE
jgi:hypothetical protein